MRNIAEMRKNSIRKQELTNQKVKRVQEAVKDVVESDMFNVAALNHLGSRCSEEEMQSFTQEVAKRTVKAVEDPINDFMDRCKVEGLKPYRVKQVVSNVANILEPHACEQKDEDELLALVAKQFSEHPNLYDDLRVFM